MASVGDIVVAASKILSEDTKSGTGGSGSKPQQNQDGVPDLKNDDGDSAADPVVSEHGKEIAVESTLDDEKEKVGVKSSSPVPDSSLSAEVNGVDVGLGVGDSQAELVSDGKNEAVEDSLTNNGEGTSTGYMDVDVDVDGDKEEKVDEKLKDQEHAFHVGDFVWGKIRSHPWWPGQIYDPNDASEFAMKRKQGGRLLVAFFGDGTCSWCSPSQLIPFVENFSRMSRDSSSKGFLKAVERAVDEVGRLVESGMTCKSVSKEKRDELARPMVENAGLKAGVIVPDIDVGCLSIPEFDPEEVLEKVRQLCKVVSTDSVLDLSIMRSWLSSFYYYKGGHQLPVYHDPLLIEGLEDKSKNGNEDGNDFSVPIEVPILGPQDDDWLSSPAVGSTDSPALRENKASHKRKQKSVAELMGENKNIKPESRKRASVKEGADSEKSLPSQKKKKKTKNDGEVGTEEVSATATATATGKKGRKRKIDEVMESPKTTDKKDSNAKATSVRGANGVKRGSLLRKPKEIDVIICAENVSEEAIEETEILSSPRERKKSKYLSPPYTNVAWRIGNLSPRTEMEVEHDKNTKDAQVGEHEKEAMEDDLASQPTPKSVDNESKEKLSNGLPESVKVSKYKSSGGVKNDEKLSYLVSDVDAPVNELLSDIELASLDPFYLTKKGSLEKVCAFASALRSSVNLQGENYAIYGKAKEIAQRKLGNDDSKTKVKSVKASKAEKKAEKRSNSKAEKKAGKTSNSSNSEKAAEPAVVKRTTDTAQGTTSPCLILQFAAGFPLPSKKAILKLFSKFGSLKRKETKVEKESHSISVVYVKDSDAEAAFKSSLSQSPFGPENATFKLQRSSGGSKARRSRSNVPSPLKRASGNREASQPTDDLVSDFNTVRQKLEITTAIVVNYLSKFSAEDKSSLKEEMKRLMEEVETVSEKVRVMAEKTAS